MAKKNKKPVPISVEKTLEDYKNYIVGRMKNRS